MKSRYYKYEAAFYVFLAALCTTYGVLAMQMPLGKASKPGQGFFPVILSLIAVSLSVVAAIQSISKQRKPKEEAPEAGVDFSKEGSVLSLFLYIGMILFFIIFANILGAYVCMLIMIFALAKIQKLPGLVKPALLSVCSTIVFYLVFNSFLGVLLPSGLLI